MKSIFLIAKVHTKVLIRSVLYTTMAMIEETTCDRKHTKTPFKIDI